MSHSSSIKKALKKSLNTVEASLNDSSLISSLDKIIDVCINSLNNGGKVIFAGNGGSASDAQHLAAELIGRLTYDRGPISALALSTNTSTLTAISNDYSFDEIFSRQIQGLAKKGDIFVGISTSGNSSNIIKAFEQSKKQNVLCIGFTGKTGGKMLDKCDYAICVPEESTANIQEAHIMVGHILCSCIQDGLKK